VERARSLSNWVTIGIHIFFTQCAAFRILE